VYCTETSKFAQIYLFGVAYGTEAVDIIPGTTINGNDMLENIALDDVRFTKVGWRRTNAVQHELSNIEIKGERHQRLYSIFLMLKHHLNNSEEN